MKQLITVTMLVFLEQYRDEINKYVGTTVSVSENNNPEPTQINDYFLHIAYLHIASL